MFHSLLKNLRFYLDSNFILRRKNLKRISTYMKGSFLEIGVGQGPDMGFFRSLESVTQYTGCDRVEHSTNYMRGDIPKSLVLYEGEHLPFGAEQFDSIVSLDCLEHIIPQEIPTFLNEVARVLKTNGYFIISCPFVYPEHCIPHDYQRFTRYGLIDYASKAGLKTVSVTSRSTTIEALLTVFNHRFFNHAFPPAIVGEFGVSLKFSAFGKILQVVFLPISIGIYLGVWAILLILSILPAQRRDLSLFSLGYTLVCQKV